MKPIKKFLHRKPDRSYIIYDYRKDVKILIEYGNMLAEKINELNEEVETLKKQLANTERSRDDV